MQNIQDKEGISKAARKKSLISYKGMTNRLIALNTGGQKMSFLTSLKVITNSSIFQEWEWSKDIFKTTTERVYCQKTSH